LPDAGDDAFRIARRMRDQRAMDKTAMRVKPGALTIIRAPKRKSCHSVFIGASFILSERRNAT
jgi:hypothetical protein